MSLQPRRVIGAMTGTSLDAIDVALVQIVGERLALEWRIERCGQRPLGELGRRLRGFAEGERLSAAEICELSLQFSHAHCRAIRDLLGAAPSPGSSSSPGGAGCDLIGIHGQTVYHAPPLSWQLFNPAPVAAEFGCKVICDFRAADIAVGGQGAPLTPIADFVMFGSEREARAVVNLGGFANFTFLPRRGSASESQATIDGIRGGDICACNHLLDGLARRLLSRPYDENGETSARGQARGELVDRIRAALTAQCAGGRSLGTGDELNALIASLVAAASAEDLLRSACAALAEIIIEAVSRASNGVSRILIAGGGAANRTLRTELERAANTLGRAFVVELSDQHGVPASQREAIAFAVLADLCDQGVPIALPRITGAKRAVRAGVACFVGEKR